MMLLKNIKDVNLLINAVDKCSGAVILRSVDGNEEFNLKSKLSQYIAIGKLCAEHGDEYKKDFIKHNFYTAAIRLYAFD